jgi:multidrug efflux pump subunit AcrB
MLAAIALMYAAGLTLNMISLFALIITLGIVVDDAIVVGEHADFRPDAGRGPGDAAENAAKPHGRAGVFGHDHDGLAFAGWSPSAGGSAT